MLANIRKYLLSMFCTCMTDKVTIDDLTLLIVTPAIDKNRFEKKEQWKMQVPNKCVRPCVGAHAGTKL